MNGLFGFFKGPQDDRCTVDGGVPRVFDVTIAGEINLDLILYGVPKSLPMEREVLASGFQPTLGSSSAIVAHNLAVLGAKVNFVTRVGRDELGAAALERLRESGADVSRSIVDPERTTGVTVLLQHGQSRRIITYPGTMTEMTSRDLDISWLRDSRHFHFSSLFLQRGLAPDLPGLFRKLKDAGLTLSLDTNDDPEDRWEGVLDELLDLVDILLPNEAEACRIARRGTLDEALAALAGRVPCVAVKCGRRGAIVRKGDKVWKAEGIEVDAVDSIGAGDSFNAGFLFAWLQGLDPGTCARAGNTTGALSTLRPGGTEAFRDKALVDRFLTTHGFPAARWNRDGNDKFVAMVTAKADIRLPLGEFQPRSMLVTPEHSIELPRFPVIDYHNHLDGLDPADVLRVMDACGVEQTVNITMKTGNEALAIHEKFHAADASRFRTIGWMDWSGVEAPDFVAKTCTWLEQMAERGMKGIKFWKDLGLSVRDADGRLVRIDDERLAPIFEKAAELRIPVMFHTADPDAFFLPIDRFNERYEELAAHPDWSFYGAEYSKNQLLEQRDRVIATPPRNHVCLCSRSRKQREPDAGREASRHLPQRLRGHQRTGRGTGAPALPVARIFPALLGTHRVRNGPPAGGADVSPLFSISGDRGRVLRVSIARFAAGTVEYLRTPSARRSAAQGIS